jgi:hypothetical protein
LEAWPRIRADWGAVDCQETAVELNKTLSYTRPLAAVEEAAHRLAEGALTEPS